MIYLLISFAGLILVLFAGLLVISRGKPEFFTDENGQLLPGSLSEKTFVNIGGVRQGMFIRSKNTNRPVLLYVHGGPCFPNYFLIEKFKPGLEDYFTVCYWEQRGGGLSFSPELKPEDLTINLLASDAIEVTRYLQKRFGKEKIYILAHSGGTPIALQAVYQAPELYEAYLSMAQITRQAESEKLAFEFMVHYFDKANDHKAIKTLQTFEGLQSEASILAFHNSLFRDEAMHQLGIGTMHKMKSVFRDIFIPAWTCRAYTLSEKLDTWKSKLRFLPQTHLKKEIIATDFSGIYPRLEVPVFFFSGRFDLTVNVALSKAYYQNLQAPLKGFYTFENSAHSPLFEEPERFREIIEKDVLHLKTDLAD